VLLGERPFPHWREHWPVGVVREARAIFAEATARLGELEGGTKRERAKILKGIVTRFNELYAREGCIETGEASERRSVDSEHAGPWNWTSKEATMQPPPRPASRQKSPYGLQGANDEH